MKKLAALFLILISQIARAGDGELRIGIGAALNNNQPVREEVKDECLYRGSLVDASAVWLRAVGGMDVQVSWTYISCSDFGTEQGVAAVVLKRYGPVKIGGGLMLGYTQGYEDWQRPYLSSDGYDPVNPVGPRQCIFCGVAVQAGYEFGRMDIQIRYWRTDFNLYPGHNGALAVLVWRL